MPTVLITGANRGLGLAFTRLYLGRGWEVIATCRKPERAAELHGLGGPVQLHALDVAEPEMIDRLAHTLAGRRIDLLLNNAAHTGPGGDGFGSTDYEAWAAMFRVNAMAPMRMAEAFLPHLERSPRPVLAVISSRMGAHPRPGHVEYRSSKAAANMVVKQLSMMLAERGVIAVALHPGWVDTGSGRSGAPLTPERSATMLANLIAGLEPGDSGSFLDPDGTPLPIVTQQHEERWYGMPPP